MTLTRHGLQVIAVGRSRDCLSHDRCSIQVTAVDILVDAHQYLVAKNSSVHLAVPSQGDATARAFNAEVLRGAGALVLREAQQDRRDIRE